VQRSQEALALAQGLSHPMSLALALNFAAILHQFRREGPRAQQRAEAAMALAREQGFPYWWAEGAIRRGWALAAQEQGEDGITQIRQGLAAYRAIGAEVLQSYYLALLVEAYGTVGQMEEALTVLTEALATVHTTGERFYEAELHRLQGELLWCQGPPDAAQAAACLQQALTIAR
jgi:predicted ATPase